jgi:hypothetical protein
MRGAILCSVYTWLLTFSLSASAEDTFPLFAHHIVDADAGTGLAITVDDVNLDGRLDIVGVSATQVAWYENPAWERHLIADTIEGSNVCIAGHDVDGDGATEFVLGADWQFNNTESGGALYLLKRGADVTQPWDAIALLDEEPTLHRVRWGDVDGDGKQELVVAPLKGRGTTGPNFQERGVELFLLRPGEDPFKTPWEREVIDTSLHVMHNVWFAWSGQLLAASFEGITAFSRHDDGTWTSERWAAGNPVELPNSGAGEIKMTNRGSESGQLLATIEPWHGTQAVAYAFDRQARMWQRHVLDDGLRGGHAVWWADFDRDGVDELLVGFRDNAPATDRPGLNIYDLKTDSESFAISGWDKHVIDDGGMATEDALAADINNDSWPDVVAFGRATGNIKYYENLGDREND